MKKKNVYDNPAIEVIEITAKYGVMTGIGDQSIDEQLSRTTDHYEEGDATPSRRQRNVWEEEEE